MLTAVHLISHASFEWWIVLVRNWKYNQRHPMRYVPGIRDERLDKHQQCIRIQGVSNIIDIKTTTPGDYFVVVAIWKKAKVRIDPEDFKSNVSVSRTFELFFNFAEIWTFLCFARTRTWTFFSKLSGLLIRPMQFFRFWSTQWHQLSVRCPIGLNHPVHKTFTDSVFPQQSKSRLSGYYFECILIWLW